jgi:hypothetical protein
LTKTSVAVPWNSSSDLGPQFLFSLTLYRLVTFFSFGSLHTLIFSLRSHFLSTSSFVSSPASAPCHFYPGLCHHCCPFPATAVRTLSWLLTLPLPFTAVSAINTIAGTATRAALAVAPDQLLFLKLLALLLLTLCSCHRCFCQSHCCHL